MYYLCPKCQKVFPTYAGLKKHYGGAHRGEQALGEEECEIGLAEAEEIEQKTRKKSEIESEAKAEKERLEAEAKAKKEREEAEDKAKKEAEISSIYKQLPEPSQIQYGVLSEFPGLDKPVVAELMSWIDLKA